MTILHKEALEYLKSLFEFPKFLLSSVAIFSTAGSFLIRDADKSQWYTLLLGGYLFSIALTLVAFVTGYSVMAATVQAMKSADDLPKTEEKFDEILAGPYYYFSWAGMSCLFVWVIVVVALATLR